MNERTFVMIKPDGVGRGLIGEILTTFEHAGLRISRLEMLHPTEEIATRHYPQTTEWLSTAGNKAIAGYAAIGKDIFAELGTNDPVEIGQMIHHRLVEFLCSGNVVIMILEGNRAIHNVRRLIGSTIPADADPASIRGHYSVDSPDLSFEENRPVYNLVHASGNPAEVEAETALWFGSTD